MSDAQWVDIDLDGKKDLIVASEWQPLRAYMTDGILFKDVTTQWFPMASNGWWNCIASVDFDNDGDLDLVVGNFGNNSPLKANEEHPMELYYPDVDGNGSADPIVTHYIEKKSVLLPMRDDLLAQIPMMKKKFNDYISYANASVQDVLTADQLTKSPRLTTNTLETIYLENTGKMFEKRPLPVEAQFSSVYAMAIADLNRDGNMDLVMAGNNSLSRIYLGRQDASHAMVLLGDGKGKLKYLSPLESGLNMRGDVRSILINADGLIFGVNNEPIKSFKIKAQKK